MGQSAVRLPNGTHLLITHEGMVPTKQEYLNAVRESELELSRGAAETPQASAETSLGSAPAFMSERAPKDVLESSLEDNDNALRVAREIKANTVAGYASAGGAVVGGVAGGKIGSALGAPFGPPGVAVGGTLGFAGGSALGAGLGQLAGYQLPGAPTEAVKFEDQLDRSFEAAQTDLGMNAAFGGLGMAGRAAGITRTALIDSFAGYRSPAIVNRLKAAREFGIQLAPADIHPKITGIYSAIFGGVPSISGPLRAFKSGRNAEIAAALGAVTGPLETGLTELMLGKNMLKSAQNAFAVRKNWYDRIYAETDAYFSSHPTLRINNDSIDAGRKYVYEQAQHARPVNLTSTTQRTTTTTARTEGVQATERTVVGQTDKQTLRAQNEASIFRPEVDDLGRTHLRETQLDPVAKAADVTSGVKQESVAETTKITSGTTARSSTQTTTEHYSTAGFDTPGKVDQLIVETMNGPEQLTYKQFKGLTSDINRALESGQATPEQAQTLLQMKENLASAAENISDPAGRALIRRSRNLYRQAMEFFENPQAANFVKVDPNFASSVKNLPRGNIPSLMPSELFHTLFHDLTVEGVQNISKQVGAENMKHAGERWVAELFEKHIKVDAKGVTSANWNELRRDFGLHAPTSAQYAATEAMLRSSRHSLDVDKLGRMIDVMEKTVGPTIPDVAKMYARGAALSGPGAGMRALLATKALSAFSVGAGFLGHVATPLAWVVGLRKFSNFLGDTKRLNVLNMATDATLMQKPSTRIAVARQIIRFLATDMVSERDKTKKPNQAEIALEETRLIGMMSEWENQSRVPPGAELSGPPQLNLHPESRY